MLYREAGVDIAAMNSVKRTIGRICRATSTPQVLSRIGLFGSLFRVPRVRRPVLVASCDGVGTKVKIAAQMGRFATVGIDIVNHSVNDILTLGAKPLFFLDYVAHSSLAPASLAEIVRGLGEACRANGCALVGGETAMMPDVYARGDFDLAGFIVGIVSENRIVRPGRARPGDVLVGLPSSGLHTNGYSLARRVLFDKAGLSVRSRVKGLKRTLGAELLVPHRSYLKPVLPLLDRVHAICHITGGGFYENIERLLPDEVSCVIHRDRWKVPAIFRLIGRLGSVPDDEMYRAFNMGMGMVLILSEKDAPAALRRVAGARLIGKAVRGTFGVAVI